MCTEEILILNQAGRFRIRPIRKEDSPAIRDIILETLVEHGAVGGGFASGDSDTQQMFDAFQKPGRQYFVIQECPEESVEGEGRVLGGAGYSYLPGEKDTCELVKMYFRKEIRGLGLGKKLLQFCMQAARKAGYKQMYLETIGQMKAARGLYEHLGFRQIDHSMGETGHYSCDVYYVRDL